MSEARTTLYRMKPLVHPGDLVFITRDPHPTVSPWTEVESGLRELSSNSASACLVLCRVERRRRPRRDRRGRPVWWVMHPGLGPIELYEASLRPIDANDPEHVREIDR